MRVALTRPVPAALVRCELTHLARQPIDLERARAQHERYESALRARGWHVERLPVRDELPDSVFVEDTAVVLEAAAIITRPGAPSRRPETADVALALARHRPLLSLEAPGTLDGGDVLRHGRTLYVGRSARTNAAATAQLARLLDAHGIAVRPVDVRGCLHLKSAVTSLGDGRLLCNPEWVDASAFGDAECLPVDAREPFAANVLALDDAILVAAAHPRTADMLDARGYRVVAIDVSELAKAEAGLTCCSILVE